MDNNQRFKQFIFPMTNNEKSFEEQIDLLTDGNLFEDYQLQIQKLIITSTLDKLWFYVNNDISPIIVIKDSEQSRFIWEWDTKGFGTFNSISFLKDNILELFEENSTHKLIITIIYSVVNS